jgi:putative transposase
MHEWQSLSHVKWECKYHLILIPKYRKRVIYGRLRKDIGPLLRELFKQKEVEVIQGFAMPDHVHILISIPPKLSISSVVGYVKGKSAVQIHRRYLGRPQNFNGCHFWSRGYCISSVGLNDKVVREYIRKQENEERKAEQLGLF